MRDTPDAERGSDEAEGGNRGDVDSLSPLIVLA
jgi:hypothetical protein